MTKSIDVIDKMMADVRLDIERSEHSILRDKTLFPNHLLLLNKSLDTLSEAKQRIINVDNQEAVMTKSIQSMILHAETQAQLWRDISSDPEALEDRDKTKEQALALAEYFEGMKDGIVEANRIIKLEGNND